VSRRRKKPLPTELVEVQIDDLSHEGLGVAHIDGKAVFIHGALPGETVRFRYTAMRKSFDKGEVVELVEASPDRVTPKCEHFGVCGGCALQHLSSEAQILYKQNMLLQELRRIGKVEPEQVLPPLTAGSWSYRRRARLSVRDVIKKERVLVGFRERAGRYVADMDRCEILAGGLGERIAELAELVASLSIKQELPQIEIACGDNVTVLVLRHMAPLSPDDRQKLSVYESESGLRIILQSKGPKSLVALNGEIPQLMFSLPDYELDFDFTPTNFVQVNAQLNQKMIALALEQLALKDQDHVLDLFCGLGNFSLPIARTAAKVVGVEGDQELVGLAGSNARKNGLENAEFQCLDLTQVPDWSGKNFNKVLVDPPRSGAEGVLSWLDRIAPEKLVYVSCHPGSLARDAGILVNELGFKLVTCGVMDMFPHTAHVESIALFERS